MKALLLAAALGLAATLPAAADGGHMHHEAAAAMSEGVVKKVDKAGGKLTIAHGPLENLGMPAMTMAFPVGNPGLLDTLKAGDKVRFRAEQRNGAIVVVALEAGK